MTGAIDPKELLGLRARPVAIAFLDAPPAGPASLERRRQARRLRLPGSMPSRAPPSTPSPLTTSTAPSAPIRHAIDLPPDRASELESTIGLMVEGEYLEMAEVTEYSSPRPRPGRRCLCPRR